MKVTVFMCVHKPFSYLPPMAVAVQGGAALASKVEGAIPDVGTGGSISEKNPAYCELTVQYYAWKNAQADYYGFCHYRRFFARPTVTKYPYLVRDRLTDRDAAHLLYTEDELLEALSSSDLLLPRAEDMGRSVYEQYVTSPHCYDEDLNLFIALLKEKYPHLAAYADLYLAQNKQYFCNMFIMKRDIFFDYCNHLFPLLEEFDRHKTLHGDFQSDRTDGYLAERFLGIYVSYLKDRGTRVSECARLDTDAPFSKRLLYRLCPPESRRKRLLRRLLRRP